MEWAHWMSDDKMNAAPDAAKPAFMNVRRVFAPIAKDVKQYKPETEVAKGILAVAAYGHSPGHSVFAVNSGNESLMVMSDTTNHPALFAKMPDWSAIFDMNADEARATRHKLLDRVASDKMQVAFYHAPFPAVGKIVRDGKGYAMVANAWGQ
jgi:glyoxylase-like metal-dependent hydrolase (beta-lactamase superfamily II)